MSRSIASTTRCRCRWRAPSMSNCTAAWRKVRPLKDPVIESVLQIESGSAAGRSSRAGAPVRRGHPRQADRPEGSHAKAWPERFRELQAGGGHVEIVQSRIQQDDLIAVAAGTLALNAQGQINGELQMTVTGIEKIIPALGIEKMLEEGVPQSTLDRVAPGVRTPGCQQSARRARQGDSRSRQGRQAERQCRRRRRHQCARQGRRRWKANRRAPSRCALPMARSISGR